MMVSIGRVGRGEGATGDWRIWRAGCFFGLSCPGPPLGAQPGSGGGEGEREAKTAFPRARLRAPRTSLPPSPTKNASRPLACLKYQARRPRRAHA